MNQVRWGAVVGLMALLMASAAAQAPPAGQATATTNMTVPAAHCSEYRMPGAGDG
jgi:hypothetical protein